MIIFCIEFTKKDFHTEKLFLYSVQNPGTGAECEGDCDNNNQCNGALQCFQRATASDFVPGCGSGGITGASGEGWDCKAETFYCVRASLT